MRDVTIYGLVVLAPMVHAAAVAALCVLPLVLGALAWACAMAWWLS